MDDRNNKCINQNLKYPKIFLFLQHRIMLFVFRLAEEETDDTCTCNLKNILKIDCSLQNRNNEHHLHHEHRHRKCNVVICALC